MKKFLVALSLAALGLSLVPQAEAGGYGGKRYRSKKYSRSYYDYGPRYSYGHSYGYYPRSYYYQRPVRSYYYNDYCAPRYYSRRPSISLNFGF